MISYLVPIALLSLWAGCQPGTSDESAAVQSERGKEESAVTHIEQRVEAACGQCQFDLQGQGCDLAVRIDGKAYYVEGTNIDDHGDAHAQDGFCNAIREAEVEGDIKDGRFVVQSFTLVPEEGE
jgi:hypothetical protein